MRCSYCGAELEAGSIYCKECGHELQIVPDYDPLDELVIGQEEPSKEARKKEKVNSQPPAEGAAEKPHSDKSMKKTVSKIVLLTGLLVVCFFVFLAGYFSMSKDSSYRYQCGAIV